MTKNEELRKAIIGYKGSPTPRMMAHLLMTACQLHEQGLTYPEIKKEALNAK